MKRFVILLAAIAAALTADAQKPMPAFLLSDVFLRQMGVAEYANEKFDFDRFAPDRPVARWWRLCDTVQDPEKKHLMSALLREGERPLIRLRWQLSSEVVRKDTVTNLYVYNDALECTLCHHAAPDIDDAEAARLRDSMVRSTLFPTSDRSVLPAAQSAFPYALQYLLARARIDASPILNYRTTIWREEVAPLLEAVCRRRGKAMRIGRNIERFARKARFETDCIYALVDADGTMPLFFFYVDGKFWLKYRGMCQYVTLASFEDVWRHDKEATQVVAYVLQPRFEAAADQ